MISSASWNSRKERVHTLKITFKEKIKLASHIERKVNSLKLPGSEIEEKIYADIEGQIKREFGLSKKHPDLKRKYIYEAHELIDAYEVPLYLKESIDMANSQVALAV